MTGSADESDGSDLSDSSSSSSFAHMSDSDDETMAATKVGIPKFTGQETDKSNKAKDWIRGLPTHFMEKGIGAADWQGGADSSTGHW